MKGDRSDIFRMNPTSLWSDVVVFEEAFSFVEVPANPESGFDSQVRQVLGQIDETLSSIESSKDRIQTLRFFVAKREHGSALDAIVQEWMPVLGVRNIIVEIASLADHRYLVEAICFGLTDRFRASNERANDIFTVVADPLDTNAGAADQIRQALSQGESVLKRNESSAARLLHVTIHLPHSEDFSILNEIWSNWLPSGHAPTRACVHTQLTDPEQRVRFECVVAPGESQSETPFE